MLNIMQIGLGYWGPNILRNLCMQDRVSVSAYDLDNKTIEKLQPQYPHVNFINKAPDDNDFQQADAVVVVTPPHTHFSLAKQALKNNCHVFVEKPMTTDVAEAEELVGLAEQINKVLMVGHTFLFVPEVRKIKELIDNKAIGQLLHIESNRKNLGKYQESGVVWDLAPHDIAMLYYWLDCVDSNLWQDGQLISRGYDSKSDIASVHLRMGANPFYYQLNLSWLHPVKTRTTYIVGDKGMIIYDMMAQDKVKVVDRHVLAHKDGFHHIDGPTTTIPILDKEEPLFKEMKEFLAAIRGTTENISDGKLGLNVVYTISKILDSTITRD